MSAGGYGSKMIEIQKKIPFLKGLIGLLYPPMPTLNTIPVKELKRIKSVLFRSGELRVLNVGCGSMVGCGRRLWKNTDTSNVLNIDIESGPGVDIVGDAHALPFQNASFDSVIMQAVIEHLHSPQLAVAETFRVLKPGGHLYLEVPFLQGFHADPYDFQRYTLVGLSKLTEQSTNLVCKGVSVGPICSLVWLIRDLLSNLTNIKLLNQVIRFFISWILAPIRYLDFLIYRTKAAQRLASEYYILVQK